MHLRKFCIFLLVTFLLSLSPGLSAEPISSPGFKSLSLGIGIFGIETNFSSAVGRHVLTFRFSSHGALDDHSVTEIGVLYELPLKWSRYIYFSIGAGVGYIWGTFSQAGREKKKFNIPIGIKFIFRLSRGFGIGLFASQSYASGEGGFPLIGICINIGR